MKRTFISSLLILLCSVGISQAQTAPLPANDVLVDITLPGQSAFIKWTNLRNHGAPIQVHSQSTITTGSIGVLSPGFRGSQQGFYAYAGDFGYTASVSDSPFDIKNVVFQSATMFNNQNVHGLTIDDYGDYKHTDYYGPEDTGSMSAGGSGSYGYSKALAALDDLVEGYTGGPVLTWTDIDGNTGSLTALYFTRNLAPPITVEIGFHDGSQGTYYNLAWQWDLSALPNQIVAVDITLPLLPHSATIGSQISISDSFGRVIPEPTTYALLISAALCGIVMLRRRNRK